MTAYFNVETFVSLYPGGKLDKNGYELSFKSEDSNYHVHIPGKGGSSKMAPGADGSMKIVLYQEHHRGGLASDDRSTSNISFDANGKLSSTIPDLQIEIVDGGKFHINDKVVKVLTDEIELIGLLLGPETEGVSVAIAEEIAEDIKLIVKAFNGLATLMNFFGEDGGRLNFPAVICHDINKVCASMEAYH